MSPYIIDARSPARDRILGKQWHHVERRAVATLEEAREEAYRIARRSDETDDGAFEHDAYRLPEDGGTIGPLPDGTVIEVARVGWSELADAADIPRDANLLMTCGDGISDNPGAALIDAYNAR